MNGPTDDEEMIRAEVELARSEIRGRINTIEGIAEDDDELAQEALEILEACDTDLAKLVGADDGSGEEPVPEGGPDGPGDQFVKLIINNPDRDDDK